MYVQSGWGIILESFKKRLYALEVKIASEGSGLQARVVLIL